jgi:hypothetical protein
MLQPEAATLAQLTVPSLNNAAVTFVNKAADAEHLVSFQGVVDTVSSF